MLNGEAAKARNAAPAVFIGNLHFGLTENDVEAWLRKEGLEFSRVNVLRHPDGLSRGCGFISVADADHLRPILERIEGAILKGRAVRARIANGSQR